MFDVALAFSTKPLESIDNVQPSLDVIEKVEPVITEAVIRPLKLPLTAFKLLMMRFPFASA